MVKAVVLGAPVFGCYVEDSVSRVIVSGVVVLGAAVWGGPIGKVIGGVLRRMERILLRIDRTMELRDWKWWGYVSRYYENVERCVEL